MAVTRGKTNPKKEKEDSKVASTSKKIQKAPKDTKAKKTTKTTKAAAEKKTSKSKSQSPAKKAAPEKKEKKAASTSSVKGYTTEQYTKYKDLLVELASKTNDQLKAMLSRNDQSTTGNKKDLVEKCADGQVLGKIPRCTKCYGGRPKFDFKAGTYKCVGYHGDTHFHRCSQKYTMEELPREEWKD